MAARYGERRRPAALLMVVAALATVSGCRNGREIDVPPAGAIEAPTFQTQPADLADSPQLAALPERDTAGLEPPSQPVDASLLAPALEALAQIDNPPHDLARVSIYAADVILGYYENGVTGRYVSAIYSADRGLSIGEPSFNEQETFPIDAIDASVPQRLIDAIEDHVPNAVVAAADIDVDLSYEFGLAWYLRVEDARGQLATVFADLDGSIIAVDTY